MEALKTLMGKGGKIRVDGDSRIIAVKKVKR